MKTDVAAVKRAEAHFSYVSTFFVAIARSTHKNRHALWKKVVDNSAILNDADATC